MREVIRIVNVGGARLYLRSLKFEGAGPSPHSGMPADGTGLKIWPTAESLLTHLQQHIPAMLPEHRPLRVCELGAGTGMLGLGLAATFEQVEVVQTDPGIDIALSDERSTNSLDWLQQNIESNSKVVGDRVSSAKLVWGDAADTQALVSAHRPFDLVIGSDLLYHPKQHGSLLQAMHRLAGSAGAILGYSCRPRAPEEAFLRMVDEAGQLRATSSHTLAPYWDDVIGKPRPVGATHWVHNLSN